MISNNGEEVCYENGCIPSESQELYFYDILCLIM